MHDGRIVPLWSHPSAGDARPGDVLQHQRRPGADTASGLAVFFEAPVAVGRPRFPGLWVMRSMPYSAQRRLARPAVL